MLISLGHPNPSHLWQEELERQKKSTGKSQAAATITLRPLIQELLIEQLAIL